MSASHPSEGPGLQLAPGPDGRPPGNRVNGAYVPALWRRGLGVVVGGAVVVAGAALVVLGGAVVVIGGTNWAEGGVDPLVVPLSLGAQVG